MTATYSSRGVMVCATEAKETVDLDVTAAAPSGETLERDDQEPS